MPAGFRRHLVGKTLINVIHCDITGIRFVGKPHTDIFINRRIECYLNNTLNLRLFPAKLVLDLATPGDAWLS